MAADQPPREDAIRSDADAELAACRQDLVLDPARDEGILDLEVADRVDGVRAAERLGADLGEADMTDIAAFDQIGDRAYRLLDRHARVEAARAVDVDMIRAEALQRVAEERLGRRRPGV